jgi:hypothetical protein
MNAITALEEMGCRFCLNIDYDAPNASPEADALLAEVAANKAEAVLHLAERNARPMHTKTSELYVTKITKGIQGGEDAWALLLVALECIGKMSGDRGLYERSKSAICAIHGVGLFKPVPLKIELEDVRKSLTMLTRPELEHEPADKRRQIDVAIKEHKGREARLLGYLYRGHTARGAERIKGEIGE